MKEEEIFEEGEKEERKRQEEGQIGWEGNKGKRME